MKPLTIADFKTHFIGVVVQKYQAAFVKIMHIPKATRRNKP
jgi:hypothetical protein